MKANILKGGSKQIEVHLALSAKILAYYQKTKTAGVFLAVGLYVALVALVIIYAVKLLLVALVQGSSATSKAIGKISGMVGGLLVVGVILVSVLLCIQLVLASIEGIFRLILTGKFEDPDNPFFQKNMPTSFAQAIFTLVLMGVGFSIIALGLQYVLCTRGSAPGSATVIPPSQCKTCAWVVDNNAWLREQAYALGDMTADIKDRIDINYIDHIHRDEFANLIGGLGALNLRQDQESHDLMQRKLDDAYPVLDRADRWFKKNHEVPRISDTVN